MINSNNGKVILQGNGLEIITDYITILAALLDDFSETVGCTKAEALIALQERTLDTLDIILN